jgi:hypothetical protein
MALANFLRAGLEAGTRMSNGRKNRLQLTAASIREADLLDPRAGVWCNLFGGRCSNKPCFTGLNAALRRLSHACGDQAPHTYMWWVTEVWWLFTGP